MATKTTVQKVQVKKAKDLLSQTPQQEHENDLKYRLEDAEKDLIRAIEKGRSEVSKLERERETKVKDYVLGGQLDVLLQYERNIDAKKADIARLELILKERF